MKRLATALTLALVVATFSVKGETPVKNPTVVMKTSMSAGELGGVDVEVSVLSPPHRIPSPESVVVGRHGVVLHKGGRSAVFLPSVATEQGWHRVALLDNLCGKAGLAGRCWTAGAELEVFEAEVFGGVSHR